EEPHLLRYVNLEHQENQAAHHTLGLGSQDLVLRRGQPFNITLMFQGHGWRPRTESLVFQVWSAHCSPGDVYPVSATIQLCSPVSASVGLYRLAVHIESSLGRQHYVLGNFVLLCNPWIKEDSVYMPVDLHLQEYVQSDYGLVYMGTHLNVCSRPWAFGQVNCNDDRGVLQGRWDGRYHEGVDPTEWSGSAHILTRWARSGFSPIRYGQCWVFAAVLCTGIFCCGPCPVSALQRRQLGIPYDTAFVWASVDADVVRLIQRGGLVLGRDVDRHRVGRLICTKRPGANQPEDLTPQYKGPATSYLPILGVSLALEKVPVLGENICLCVTVSNRSGRHRLLQEHLHAQLKGYNSDVCVPFWHTHAKLSLRAGEVVTLHHSISPLDYESLVTCTDIVNVAVVIKDTRTKERVLATEEFNLTSPHISIQVQGGDSIQVRTKHAVHVSFTNTLTKPLSKAVLMLEGFGLFQGKQHTGEFLRVVVK
ncbi:hypothetical protein CRUP_035277, partial [Coryphaenoides rupestris]